MSVELELCVLELERVVEVSVLAVVGDVALVVGSPVLSVLLEVVVCVFEVEDLVDSVVADDKVAVDHVDTEDSVDFDVVEDMVVDNVVEGVDVELEYVVLVLDGVDDDVVADDELEDPVDAEDIVDLDDDVDEECNDVDVEDKDVEDDELLLVSVEDVDTEVDELEDP
eukprot:3828029-Amphidinium_carterae.1